MSFATVDSMVAELRAGAMVIIADDEQRENEGDFVLAAQLVTPTQLSFMAEHARTIITLAMTSERCDRLNLPLMTGHGGGRFGTAFTVTIEAAVGVTSGSSAIDRATTIRAAVAADAKPEDLVRPGHVFPLRAALGGVLNRAGHTEAACDLARLAGFEPAGVISEIQLAGGEMARMPDLQRLAAEHGLKLGTITSLIEHRCRSESLIERQEAGTVQTASGSFAMRKYTDKIGGGPHIALIRGDLAAAPPPLVRVLPQPEPLDLLALRVPGRSWSAAAALERINNAEAGLLLLLQDGQYSKATSEGQEAASTAVRNYGIGAQILRDLGVTRMRLLSSPLRLPSLEGYGLDITEIITAP